MVDMVTIGRKIQQSRKDKHMTQTDLGRLVGIGKSAISQYEHGTVVNMTTDMANRFANALDMNILELTGLDAINSADDTNELLEALKNDPDVRMVAKISGTLTEQGKKDLRKYAELLRNQRDNMSQD